MQLLTRLLVGGEAMTVSLARQLDALLPGRLLNMYGPTETTVWSAAHPVTTIGESVPIGRPLANTELFVLDAHLQPVPAGVAGELFIGGEGVARGYLNRPGLTAQKFIPHPFRPTPNTRLYRTGDRARFRADGTMEFLGRLDQQVKIRGHRIELGEIETVLRQHAQVRECAVHIWEAAPGDQRLVACVVSEPARARPDANDLRLFLKSRLPDEMVPAAFILLDKLPLTPNGKLDRKALPHPEKARPEGEAAYAAPRTGMEKGIARIWAELLRIETVGLHDNFFDLGGHSLLVVQAQARLRDGFGVNVPVVRLFQHPTVGALARFLENGESRSSLQGIRDRGRKQRASFAPPREREAIA